MWIGHIGANRRRLRDERVSNLRVRIHAAWRIVLGVANVTTDRAGDLNSPVWVGQSSRLQLGASVAAILLKVNVRSRVNELTLLHHLAI